MFFLSPRCLLCNRSCDRLGSALCHLCATCERQICSAKRAQPLEKVTSDQLVPIFAWADYEGNLRQSIAQLKYHRRRTIGTWLGQQMADAWIGQDLHRTLSHLVVVPIPMFAAKEKMRGYNQAAVIAQQFAQTIGYRYEPRILRRDRETEAQYAVDSRSRTANLESAFTLGPLPKLRSSDRILLVDDIYTTGATVRSALTTLRPALKIWGVAVAARPVFETRSYRGTAKL